MSSPPRGGNHKAQKWLASLGLCLAEGCVVSRRNFFCNLVLAEQITHIFCDFILGHCLAIVKKGNAGSVSVLLFCRSYNFILLMVVTVYHCFFQ